MLGALGGSTFYIITRLNVYYKHNVSVSIQRKYDPKNPGSLEFPAVVLCNYNRFFFNPTKLESDYKKLIFNYNFQFNNSASSSFPLTKPLTYEEPKNQSWVADKLSDPSINDYYNSVSNPAFTLENFKENYLKPELERILDYHVAHKNTEDIHAQITAAKDMMDILSPDVHNCQVNTDRSCKQVASSSNDKGTAIISDSGSIQNQYQIDHSIAADALAGVDTNDDLKSSGSKMLNLTSIFNQSATNRRRRRRNSSDASFSESFSDYYDYDYYESGSFNASNLSYDYLEYYYPGEFQPYNSIDQSLEKELLANYSSLTVSSLLAQYGWNLDEQTILYTNFKGAKNKISETWIPIILNGGVCFKLNKTITQLTAGPGNGLVIALNLMQKDYTESFTHDTEKTPPINSIMASVGAKIYLYDPNEPIPDTTNAIDISPGFKTSISMQKNHYDYMYKPWSHCDKETRSKEFSTYTLHDCIANCYVLKVVEHCNCKPSFAFAMKNFEGIKECTLADVWGNGTSITCRNKLSSWKKRMSAQTCGCLEPCKHTKFESSLSFASFPSAAVLENFKKFFEETSFFNYLELSSPENNRDIWSDESFDYLIATNKTKNATTSTTIESVEREKDILGNLALIDLFYGDLKYTHLEESKADEISSLISDLGGQLGLWMGVSILTACEILFCVFCIMPKILCVRLGCLSQKEIEVEGDW